MSGQQLTEITTLDDDPDPKPTFNQTDPCPPYCDQEPG